VAGDRIHFVMWDFLRMLVAAIAMGAAFSVFAAGVVLLLTNSRDANAQWTPADGSDGLMILKSEVAQQVKETSRDDSAESEKSVFVLPVAMDSASDMPSFDPTPGNLYLGEGCGSDPIVAVERDWFVSVEQSRINVRVMQTFMLPIAKHEQSAEPITARFYANLPAGARLRTMKVDSDRGELLGVNASQADWDADDIATVKSYSARGEIRMFEYRAPHAKSATLSSDVIDGIVSGETIVVTYQYEMPLNAAKSLESLALALDDTPYDVIEGTSSPSRGFGDSAADNKTDANRDLSHEWIEESNAESFQRPITTGTVWVEWKADAPKSLRNAPLGSVIERDSKSNAIKGLSWTTPRIASLEQFNLVWAK
jgi:hypothetical protein